MIPSVLCEPRRAFVISALCLLAACGSDGRRDHYYDSDAGAGYGGPETGVVDTASSGGDAQRDASGDGQSDTQIDSTAKDTDATADGNLDAESGDAPVSLPL